MKQIQYTESGDWNLQTDYDRLTDQTATFFVCPTFHSDTQRVTFEITGPPNRAVQNRVIFGFGAMDGAANHHFVRDRNGHLQRQ